MKNKNMQQRTRILKFLFLCILGAHCASTKEKTSIISSSAEKMLWQSVFQCLYPENSYYKEICQKNIAQALKDGANPDVLLPPKSGDFENYTPLMVAAKINDAKMLKTLIAGGANVNYESTELPYTPIRVAITGGSIECLRLLIASGAKLVAGTSSSTPLLHLAVVQRVNNRSKFTATYRVSTEVQDMLQFEKDEFNREFYNTMQMKSEIIQVLLAAGADVNVRDSEGSSVLAGFIGPWEMNTPEDKKIALQIIETIFAAGLSIDEPDKWGQTLLISLTINKYIIPSEIFTMIIKKTKNINAKDKSGNTALSHTANQGNHEMLKILIENGAKYTGENIESLWETEEQVDFKKTIALLKRAGYRGPSGNWRGLNKGSVDGFVEARKKKERDSCLKWANSMSMASTPRSSLLTEIERACGTLWNYKSDDHQKCVLKWQDCRPYY